MCVFFFLFDESRPLSWIQAQGMGAFLSIAKGSVEAPWLMEVRYNGGRPEEKPLVLVGKGKQPDQT